MEWDDVRAGDLVDYLDEYDAFDERRDAPLLRHCMVLQRLDANDYDDAVIVLRCDHDPLPIRMYSAENLFLRGHIVPPDHPGLALDITTLLVGDRIEQRPMDDPFGRAGTVVAGLHYNPFRGPPHIDVHWDDGTKESLASGFDLELVGYNPQVGAS